MRACVRAATAAAAAAASSSSSKEDIIRNSAAAYPILFYKSHFTVLRYCCYLCFAKERAAATASRLLR